MVQAYWLIGREIVEVDQKGKARAGYGDRLVRQLAVRLSERYGKGFSYPSIKRMKQFYLTFPQGSTIPPDAGRPDTGSALLSQSSAEKGSATLSLLPSGRETLFHAMSSRTISCSSFSTREGSSDAGSLCT
jgi:hypothetical protein